jgi:hypothetical protein
MHLCARGDALTSLPTTIFQLEFVAFSKILHSLLLFCLLFFSWSFFLFTYLYRQWTKLYEWFQLSLNILMRIIKKISRNQFRLFCFCFDKCSLLVLLYNLKSLKSCRFEKKYTSKIIWYTTSCTTKLQTILLVFIKCI